MIEANYVFAFVGEAERPDEWSDEGTGRATCPNEQELSTVEWSDCEIPAITRMKALKQPRVKIGLAKEWKFITWRTPGLVVFKEV